MKYGRSEDNRAFGTALDLCVIEKIWTDGKQDFVRYFYNHPKRSISYTAYLPKGNLAQVGVREGRMYKVWTSKSNRTIPVDASGGVENA